MAEEEARREAERLHRVYNIIIIRKILFVGFTGTYAKTGGRKTRERRTAKNGSPKEERRD